MEITKQNLEKEMKSDQELYSYFVQRNQHLCEVNFQYLADHPEIKLLLNDFLSSVLMHKPDDLFKYTKEYFSILCTKPSISKLILVIGPIGVGKTTLTKKLMNEFSSISKVIKYTTKKPTNSEEDGKDYYFISHEKFLQMETNKEFIEHCFIDDNYYGTTMKEVEKLNNQNKTALMIVDIITAKNIYSSGLLAYYIGIIPPNIAVLRERISFKSKENKLEEINKILKLSYREVEELKNINFLNFNIVNDDIEIAYLQLKSIYLSLFPNS